MTLRWAKFINHSGCWLNSSRVAFLEASTCTRRYTTLGPKQRVPPAPSTVSACLPACRALELLFYSPLLHRTHCYTTISRPGPAWPGSAHTHHAPTTTTPT